MMGLGEWLPALSRLSDDVQACTPVAWSLPRPGGRAMTPMVLTLGPAAAATDLVAFGENSLDFVAELPAGEPPAGKRQLRSFRVRPGGQMATAAIGAARLGLRVHYVGAFGDDDWGARVRATLVAEGVRVEAIVRRGVPTRAAIVLVSADGERDVLESRHPDLRIELNELPIAVLVNARVLLIDHTHGPASVEAARAARQAGVPTVVDIDQVGADVDHLLDQIDVIICPEPFVRAWSGFQNVEAGHAALARRFSRAAVVVVTCGPAGSVALAGGRRLVSHGFRVVPVDTTGAGDAFRAGFIAAWVRAGDGGDLEAMLERANATAALNCRAAGAQAGLPSLAEVEALLNEAQRVRSN
jgi:sulfofructose kinase